MDIKQLAGTAKENISDLNNVDEVLSVIKETLIALKEVNREDLSSEFTSELISLLKTNSSGIAYIHSPVSLEKGEQETIKSKLEKKFGVSIDIKVVIDESIIGGILIKYKDEEIDLTTNSKIRQIVQSV